MMNIMAMATSLIVGENREPSKHLRDKIYQNFSFALKERKGWDENEDGEQAIRVDMNSVECGGLWRRLAAGQKEFEIT